MLNNFFARLCVVLSLFLFVTACNQKAEQSETTQQAAEETKSALPDDLKNKYTEFTLTTDMTALSENQKKMIGLLIEVSDIMDHLFWIQAYGDKDALLNSIEDPEVRRFAEINYGPWDRLNGDKPFIDGVGEKPKTANLYPADATKEEVEQAEDPKVRGQYSMVVRDENGKLMGIPYSEYFKEALEPAAAKIREAAELAADPGLKDYLNKRADALMSNEYYESDLAWMDMKDNQIDFVVGPIENYEDKLMGLKNIFEAYVLVKDMAWSERLAKYASFLPELQKGLPVDDAYKKEMPGTDSDLNAYDVVYYAGDCNAGSKTIAINLPNDEAVQKAKGTRRLQLKNAMRAKFDKILVPLSGVLIAEDLRGHVTFDAFFANTMFHEVAHGLGIKDTINGKGTVREALAEEAGALEEGKADVLGLYMVSQLIEKGEMESDLKDHYVTFTASIFRSIRFGATSAHGRANLLRFNFFMEKGAIVRDDATGTYSIDFDKFAQASSELSNLILTIQGDGDYDRLVTLMKEKGQMSDQLKSDLDRLAGEGIPTDVVFKQGKEVLGL